MNLSMICFLPSALTIPVALPSSLILLAGHGAVGPPNLLTCSLYQHAD